MTSPLHDEEQDESAEDIRRDEESAAGPAELWYPNVGEFVTDRLVYLVARPAPDSGLVWCSQWFRHAEALGRLDSVWRAWEALRWDGGQGMSSWWTHHLDPHMRALLDPVTGPFARCADGHRSQEPLPLDPAPEGLFERHQWPPSKDPFALD